MEHVRGYCLKICIACDNVLVLTNINGYRNYPARRRRNVLGVIMIPFA
jgi:hypothetical protein